MKTLLFFLILQSTTSSTQYFKKDASGKVIPCGDVAERNGFWRANLEETHTHSQLFDTKAEAVTWIKHYCPIEGAK